MLAAAFGLAAILHSSALLFTTVKFAGVAYLLWLAWQSLRADGAIHVSARQTTDAGPKIAMRGVLINVLNPKLSIFFLALLPPFLSGNPDTATLELGLMGGVFMGLTFVLFSLYGIFAASARRMILGSERAMRWLNRSFAAVFTLLAGRLALEHG